MGKVTFNRGWENSQEQAMNDALLEVATDVQRRAAMLAPRETGALVNSGTIERVEEGYRIKYGSARVPYARIRHEVNKKNPQTRGYLAKAADGVARGNLGKYFRFV